MCRGRSRLSNLARLWGVSPIKLSGIHWYSIETPCHRGICCGTQTWAQGLQASVCCYMRKRTNNRRRPRLLCIRYNMTCCNFETFFLLANTQCQHPLMAAAVKAPCHMPPPPSATAAAPPMLPPLAARPVGPAGASRRCSSRRTTSDRMAHPSTTYLLQWAGDTC